MNAIKKYLHSFYRQYRFLLLLFLVIALQLSFPGLFSAVTHQPESIVFRGCCRRPGDCCGWRYCLRSGNISFQQWSGHIDLMPPTIYIQFTGKHGTFSSCLTWAITSITAVATRLS